MYIRRKVYSVLTDDCGQERLFSTNEIYLDDYEDERFFSKMEDEDYIEDIKKGAKAKKDYQNLVRKGQATVGGLLGLAGGATVGGLLSSKLGAGAAPIGAALGAAGGALIGNRLGKKQQKKKEKAIDEKLQRDLDKYNNASEKDKKYLREKIKSEALRNAILTASPYTSRVEGDDDED